MTTQTILGIIFFILTISPLIYFGKVAKNRSQRAKKRIEAYASEQNSAIDDIEFWNDKAFGINKEKKQLFYTSLQQNNEQTRIIDIKSIKHCSVSVKKTTIELLFEFKNATTSVDRIQIYNSEFDDVNEVGYHNQLAIRWSKKTMELIDRKKGLPLRKSA
jgi:hypothetical protein